MLKLFTIVFCLVELCPGSKIVFRSSPLYITEGLTRTLNLRCSLQDTANVDNNIIGKRDSVTQIPDNVQHVSSIIITTDTGEHVADVTTFSAASARIDFHSLQVTSNLAPSTSSEHGYLNLVWTNPGQNQSGGYTCEINAIDHLGHNIVFTTSTEIGVEFPSQDDLIKHVHLLEDISETTQERLNSLEAAVSKLKAPHSEEGTVHCGSSSTWSNDPRMSQSTKLKVFDVAFKQPYGTVPTINMGIYRLDLDHGSDTRIHTDAFNITTIGFQLRCATWGDSKVNDIAVRWTSVVA